MQHVSAGTYQVTITAPACAQGSNAPVITVSDANPPSGQRPARSRSRGTSRRAATSSSWCSPAMVVGGSFTPTRPHLHGDGHLHVGERMNRGAFRGWVAVAASVAVCLLAAVAAPAARAGTIWVTDGAGSCNAFSVYGEPRVVHRPLELPDVDPGGQSRSRWGRTRYWMTTAPPGITINQRVDRKRRRERRQLDHRRGRRGLLAETSTPGRTADRRSRRASTGSTPGSRAARTSTARSTASRSSAPRATGASEAAPTSNPPWFTVSGIELEGTENSRAVRDRTGRPVDDRIVRVESARG